MKNVKFKYGNDTVVTATILIPLYQPDLKHMRTHSSIAAKVIERQA